MVFRTQEEADRVEALLRKARASGASAGRPECGRTGAQAVYGQKGTAADVCSFVFQKGIGEMMTFGENSYARPVSEEDARAVLEALQ